MCGCWFKQHHFINPNAKVSSKYQQFKVCMSVSILTAMFPGNFKKFKEEVVIDEMFEYDVL